MIYLYDAMFNTKKECTLKYVASLFKINREELNGDFKEGKCIRKGGRWFIIDDSTSVRTIRELHSKINLKYEAWKYIEGTNGEYLISSYGRVKDKNGRFYLSYQKNLRSGKKSVRYLKLKIDGKIKEFSVSRLVAFHFVLASERVSFNDFKRYRVVHKNKFSHDDYFGNLAISLIS